MSKQGNPDEMEGNSKGKKATTRNMAKDAFVAVGAGLSPSDWKEKKDTSKRDKFREKVRGDAVATHHSDAFCLKFLRRLDRGGLLLSFISLLFPLPSQSG